MQYRINTDSKKFKGKRPNLSGKNTVADEIVSVLSLPPEEMPLPPLSPLPTTKPRAPRKRNPQGLCIAGAILVFLPFLYPIAFFVKGFTSGQPMPFYMYPILVSATRFIPFFGGLVLYLGARAANTFRKSIGWVTLANIAFSFGSMFFLVDAASAFSLTDISRGNALGFLALSACSLLCMLALCVLSILLLSRVFRKEKQSPAE